MSEKKVKKKKDLLALSAEAIEPALEILGESSKTAEIKSTTVSESAVFSSPSSSSTSNPLNPVSEEAIAQGAYLEKTYGRNYRGDPATGKRYISIQAYHADMVQDPSIPAEQDRYGTKVRVVKKPSNGVGWDEVVSVSDNTSYTNTDWYANTAPNYGQNGNGGNLDIVNGSNYFELKYTRIAFNPAAGNYNYPDNNGIFTIQLYVLFASGHEEIFDIQLPVGNSYGIWTQQAAGGTTTVPDMQWEVYGCGRSERDEQWYSKGTNILQTETGSTDEWGRLTRIAPDPKFNPGGTLKDVGLFTHNPAAIQSPVSNFFPINLIMPITPEWADPLTELFDVDGIVTVNSTQVGKQVINRLDVLSQEGASSHPELINNETSLWYITNYLPIPAGSTFPSTLPGDTTNEYFYDDGTLGTVSTSTSYAATLYVIKNQTQNQRFTSTLYYSENIINCGLGNATTTYSVCNDSNTSTYFLTTSQDCNGNTIPAADLPGGANYNAGNVAFVHNQECCTDCGNFQATVQAVQATIGNTDGYITWDARVLGSPSGDIWATGSSYTVTVEDANGTAVGTAAPTGGNTFTDATCDTSSGSNLVACNSSVKILPGMHVSGTGIPTGSFVGGITVGAISTNVTQFTLVDSLGLTVTATATNTNTTLTFSTGYNGQHGALAPNTAANPFYTVCVTDELGCVNCSKVVIGEGEGSGGCTNSNAINYDSTAVYNDGSCILCNSTSGLLEDPSGTATTDMFSSTLTTTDYATYDSSAGSHNSDGAIHASASAAASIIPYLDLTANAEFKIKLYKTNGPNEPSSTPGATLIQTVSTGNLTLGTNPNHTFSSMAYGFYTLRWYYVDNDSVSTMEDCWQEVYAIIQAEVCNDPGSSYTTPPSGTYPDTLLRYNSNILCSNISCCNLGSPAIDNSGSVVLGSTICNAYIYVPFHCDTHRNVTIDWELDDGFQMTFLATHNLGVIAPGNSYVAIGSALVNGVGPTLLTSAGTYKITLTGVPVMSSPGATTCTETVSINWTPPPEGCTNPLAVNYDALAICDDGSCIDQSWDCDPFTGFCFDPGTGNGQFSCETGPGCCDTGCVQIPIYGCTDPCAINYNPSTNTDDGSCEYSGCTDPAALNTYTSCCDDSAHPAATFTVTDNSCCVMPCANPNYIALTTVDATSTCTTFNFDGFVSLTYTSNNSATTFTWQILNSTSTSTVYADTTTYSIPQNTGISYSLLGVGNYILEVTDNLGCVTTRVFTINSTDPVVGCTDPNATNYDPNATCDCGCCLICGCMDPNATNYNPSATEPCECEYYDLAGCGPNPCVPLTLDSNQERIDACLSIKGTDWLHDYKLGRATDCSIMNKWILIFIEYLFSQSSTGLDCLFNCADESTMDLTAVQNCDEIWKTGGPSTGDNHDSAHLGTLGLPGGNAGTTVTSYDGYPIGWFGYDSTSSPTSNKTFMGDVIKFDLNVNHPFASQLNGTIWILTYNNGTSSGMHQGCPNAKLAHYTQCIPSQCVSITETTNYYDKFINFVNKFCQDCNITTLNNNIKI